MKIHGLNKLTLLDYPGHMACLVFTGACNYRCPFCHNASLVLHPNSQPLISEDEIFRFLKSRTGILEGVCISGGEPTLQPDLPEFIRKVKDLGFRVKLDTNGSRPEILNDLLTKDLLDYVSMDIKNTLSKYPFTVGLVNSPSTFAPSCPDNLVTEAVQTSVKQLMNSDILYEFRTTLVRELHTEEDLLSIAAWLQGAKAYYLQAFRDSDTLVGAEKGQFHGFSREELLHFCELLAPYFGMVAVRGID